MTNRQRFRRDTSAWVAIAVVLVCAARVASLDTVVSPDSHAYLRMADNIRLNGCLSYAEPAVATCEPTWGTQPPGYPGLLAAARTVTTAPGVAIGIQVVLFGLAAFWLAAGLAPGRPATAGAIALVICASPLTFAWSRWILTETLAAASVMIVFGVLARAIRHRRLPILMTGTALMAALLLRWDLLLLVVPIAIVALAIQTVGRAAVQVAMISTMAAAPYTALVIRASVHGLPLSPPSPLDEDLPDGLLRFWRTTAVDQRATSQLIWPAWSRDYHAASRLEPDAITSRVPRDRLESLVALLAAVPAGEDIPRAVDSAFTFEAAQVVERHGAGLAIVIQVTRAWRMWTNDDAQYRSGWQHSPAAGPDWERWRTAYRVVLMVLIVAAAVTLRGPPRLIAIGVLAFAVARTAFLVSVPISMLETRLLTPLVPVVEAVGVLVVSGVVARWRGVQQGVVAIAAGRSDRPGEARV